MHARVAGVDDLRDRVPHIVGREELALLDVDDAPGLRGGDEQIGLTARETPESAARRRLRRPRPRLRRLVNVGEDRHVVARLDRGEHAQPLVEPGTAERSSRRAVRLVVRRLEDERHAAARRAMSASAPGELDGVRLAFDDARARRSARTGCRRRS